MKETDSTTVAHITTKERYIVCDQCKQKIPLLPNDRSAPEHDMIVVSVPDVSDEGVSVGRDYHDFCDFECLITWLEDK